MPRKPSSRQSHPSPVIRGANDNSAPGEACVTDAGAPLPYPSITADELEILKPLIAALARMGTRAV